MNDWISRKKNKETIHVWLDISTYAQIIQRMGQAGFEQQKCEAHEMIQGGKLMFFYFFGEIEMDLLSHCITLYGSSIFIIHV